MMSDEEEMEIKRQEVRIKIFDFLWKLSDSSFDKNLRIANLALVGNAAALVACLAVFRDFKDKIAIDTLASAGFYFCVGMIASSAMLALTWLSSEITAVFHAKVAAQDFSEESWDDFKEVRLKFLFPRKTLIFDPTMALVGIIMAIPYAIAVFCFFLGVIKIANNITCMFACS
jgi:hypothetical protein